MVDGANSSALRVEQAACDIKAVQKNHRRQIMEHLPAKGALLARRSEFGRQIAVDLKPDTDFDKRWRGPDHVMSSSCDHVERSARLFRSRQADAERAVKIYHDRRRMKMLR